MGENKMRKIIVIAVIFYIMLTGLDSCANDTTDTKNNPTQAAQDNNAKIESHTENSESPTQENTTDAEKPIDIDLSATLGPVDGATFYVDIRKGKDNADAGSFETPFKTLSYAAGKVTPGSVVVVMPGVYEEGAGGSKTVNLTVDGTADKWITFKAHPSRMAKDLLEKTGDFDKALSLGVVVIGRWEGGAINVRASYQQIEGFFVTAYEDIEYACGISVRDVPENAGKNLGNGEFTHPGNHHIRIINNVAFNIPQAGIASGNNEYLEVTGNIVYQNSSTGNWEGSGISVGFIGKPYDGPDSHPDDFRIIVDGNICYNNSGFDIGRRKSLGHITPWQNGHPGDGSTDGNGIIIDWAQESRTLIRNNILYNNGARGICLTSSGNVVVVNNTSYDNGWDSYQQFHLDEFSDWYQNKNSNGNNNIYANNIFYVGNPNRNNHKKFQPKLGFPNKTAFNYQGYNLFAGVVVSGNAIHEGDLNNQDPLFMNAPPLIGTNDRAVPKMTDNKSEKSDFANAYPLDTYHYWAVDFSLRPESPAIGSGYKIGGVFTKPKANMTDTKLAELKKFLELGLPEYDIFGNKRDPANMDMGAVAYNIIK
jgi:serralysin